MAKHLTLTDVLNLTDKRDLRRKETYVDLSMRSMRSMRSKFKKVVQK